MSKLERITSRVAVCLVLVFSAPALGQDAELVDMSLEELMKIQVTSVSKKSETMMDVPSAVYVVTSEDIRRSGATRLQEVLRLVPGTWIADHSYNVSEFAIRDQNELYNLSVLVLLDGVPINNPLLGGISFDGFDIAPSEIDRIEVIKGPGGTIYGANSATGVVNIFTRDARVSEGFNAIVEGGTHGYFAQTLQYGTQAGQASSITGWLRLKHHDGYDDPEVFAGRSVTTSGQVRSPSGGVIEVTDTTFANPFAEDNIDDLRSISGGATFDFMPSRKLSLRTKFFGMRSENRRYSTVVFDQVSVTDPRDPLFPAYNPVERSVVDTREQYLLLDGRVDYQFSPEHAVFVHAYASQFDNRWAYASGIEHKLSVAEVEVQDNLRFFSFNRLSLGMNARMIHYAISKDENEQLGFVYPNNTEYLIAGFVQNTTEISDRADFTLGAKAESWSLVYTTPEISPSARLSLRPVGNVTLWAAASRSITTPGYIQTNMEYKIDQLPPAWVFQQQGMPVPAGAGRWVAIINGEDVEPVDYHTYEAGLRTTRVPNTTIDISAFYTRSHNRIALIPIDETLETVVESSVTPGDTIVPLYYANTSNGEHWGGEAVLRTLIGSHLRWELSYALYRDVVDSPFGIEKVEYGVSNESTEPKVPEHIVRTRVYLDFWKQTHVTVNAMWNSAVSVGDAYNFITLETDEELGVNMDEPGPRFRMDFKVEKGFMDDLLSFYVWGNDVLSEGRVDYYSQLAFLYHPHQVQHSFGVGLTMRFANRR